MDIIGCLPPEISQQVLLYLDSEDIEVVSKGIEEWKHLFDDYFWKKLCRKNGYREEEVCLSSNIYRECMLKHSNHWQAIYTYNRVIQSNWESGNYKFISVRTNVTYNRILYFDDEILVASQYLEAITFVYTDIIDLSTGNLHLRFDEKTNIQRIIKHQNLLIYFVDKTLKVLNLETKSWILDLELPEVSRISSDGIYLEERNNLLAVLNPSDVFYVVNLETKTINFKILGVLQACFGDNVITVVMKRSKKLQVLDLNGKLLMNINYGGGLSVEHILMKGGNVVLCYSQIDEPMIQKVSFSTIQLETKSLQEIRSIDVIYFMFCSLNKNTMLFWNYQRERTSTMMWRFPAEDNCVTFDSDEKQIIWALANNRYLFLYTEDCVLSMWCAKTGKFIKDITKRDMVVYLYRSFNATEKKFAYINSQYGLCIQNYDFIA